MSVSVSNVTDELNNAGLTIGTQTDATDGWDPTLDTQSPANPSAKFASVTIRHLTTEDGWTNHGGFYDHDLRSPIAAGQNKTWDNITVASDLGTSDTPAQIVLTWDLSSVDPDIQLTFQDPNDVNGDGITSYDMRKTLNFPFPSSPSGGQSVNFSQFSITASNSELQAPPSITGLATSNLTSTGFSVSFTTNVPTGAILQYGTSPTDLSQKATATDATTAHNFDLTGLTPNTTYYYQVTTDQAGFSPAISDVQSLQTLQTLNLVGNIQIQPSDTSATINFQTSAPATAVVKYGTAQDKLDQQVAATTLQTNQSVLLPGLNPGQQYFVQVVSSADGFDSLTSDVLSFSTLGSFTLSTPVVTDVTATSATVTVNTGQAATVTLKYGTTALDHTLTGTAPGTSQTFKLTGLTAGTTYQLQATASAAGFEDKTSTTVNFDTLKTFQITAQQVITNITANSATISLSTSVPVAATLQYGTDSSLPLSSVITTPTNGPVFNLTDLLSKTNYQFKIVLQAPGYESITTVPESFDTLEAITFGNGDVNGDGKTDIADAALAARAVIGLVQLTPAQLNAADTRAPKGSLDIGDVVWILKIAVGLVPPPPG